MTAQYWLSQRAQVSQASQVEAVQAATVRWQRVASVRTLISMRHSSAIGNIMC